MQRFLLESFERSCRFGCLHPLHGDRSNPCNLCNVHVAKPAAPCNARKVVPRNRHCALAKRRRRRRRRRRNHNIAAHRACKDTARALAALHIRIPSFFPRTISDSAICGSCVIPKSLMLVRPCGITVKCCCDRFGVCVTALPPPPLLLPPLLPSSGARDAEDIPAGRRLEGQAGAAASVG